MPTRELEDSCSILREAIPRLVGMYNGRYERRARVGEVLRTAEEQGQKWLQGRGLPGRIVTHADGVKTLSAHQARVFHGETASHAVDIDVVSLDGKNYITAEQAYWPLIGLATAVGLKSGGDFMKPDFPHLYCPHWRL